MMKCNLRNDPLALLIAALLVLNIPGCIASVLHAGSAFYQQVILKQPYGTRLRISPDQLRPIEGCSIGKSYCGLHKARLPKVPQTITI